MKSTSEWIVKEALLDADRDFNSPNPYGKPIDIYGMIAEVSIHESLDKPYLTANLAIVDTQDVISGIVDLQGTEKLKLTMSTNFEKDGSDNNFVLNLRVVSIIDEAENDYSKVYHINCITEYAYDNSNVQISRSYTGQLEDMVENILDDYLNVKTEKDPAYWDGETIQGRVKLIVPYLSPLETVSWLTERGCMYDAAPIFTWATVWDGAEEPKVRMGDLSTMCEWGTQDVISADLGKTGDKTTRTFVYSKASPNSKDADTTDANKSVIKEFSGTTSSSDTLKMINHATVGSRFATLDTYTTQKFDRHFNLQEFLDFYQDNLMLEGEEKIFEQHYDKENMVTVQGQKKTPAEFDARHRNVVTSYGTYEWENSYHDVPDPTAAMNKVRKGVLRSLLNKETVNVTLPGMNFMTEELGSGDVVRLVIPRTFTDDEAAKSSSKDMSGMYLILALRHVFISNTHDVIATCAKIQDDAAE